MNADEFATWLTDRGWDIEVLDAVTIAASKSGKRHRRYCYEPTLIGSRWVIRRP